VSGSLLKPERDCKSPLSRGVRGGRHVLYIVETHTDHRR
jgi:hypothetical protein